MNAKPIILLALVAISFSSVASAKYTGLPTKGGFESHQEYVQAPQQPLVQSTSYSAPVQTEFRQPEILQAPVQSQQVSYAPVQTQQVNYAPAPVRPSYPTKGGFEYVSAPQQSFVSAPLQQSSFAAPIMQETRQPEILAAPVKGSPVVWNEAPLRPSYPTKGGLEYAPAPQQSFVSAPVQQSFVPAPVQQSFAYSAPVQQYRQPEILAAPVQYSQAPLMTQQPQYIQAPVRPSYPTKGGLEYAPALQQPLVQSTSYAAPVQAEFRQPEILQAPVKGHSLVKRAASAQHGRDWSRFPG